MVNKMVVTQIQPRQQLKNMRNVEKPIPAWHWKCRVRVKLHRGFESLPLRLRRYQPVACMRFSRLTTGIFSVPIAPVPISVLIREVCEAAQAVKMCSFSEPISEPA